MKIKKYLSLIILFIFTIVPAVSLAQNNNIPPLETMPRNTINQLPISPSTTLPSSTLRTVRTFSSSFGCDQLTMGDTKVGDLFNYATCVISTSVIPLIFALAIAMFIWGVVQYVINDDEEAKKQKGKQFMIWGIIALAVMVSVWGLVGILRNTFGIDNVIPQVQNK